MTVHEKSLQGYFIHEEKLDKLYNYICSNLVSWSPNHEYWNEQYTLVNELYFVIHWRKKNNLLPRARRGGGDM